MLCCAEVQRNSYSKIISPPTLFVLAIQSLLVLAKLAMDYILLGLISFLAWQIFELAGVVSELADKQAARSELVNEIARNHNRLAQMFEEYLKAHEMGWDDGKDDQVSH